MQLKEQRSIDTRVTQDDSFIAECALRDSCDGRNRHHERRSVPTLKPGP
jgi:hypothetical protein